MAKLDGHKLAGSKHDALSAGFGAVVEAKTGEKYKSKFAMMKHEKSESKAMRQKEYGSKGMKKGMH